MTGAGDTRPTGLGAERLIEGPWRVVVVGAGGWMGLAALESLRSLLGDRFADRVVAFGSAARDLALRSGPPVRQHPLSALPDLPPHPSLVLHLAFLTQEKAAGMDPADYGRINRGLSGAVLSALDRIGAEGVFLASSGATTLVDRPGADPNKALYGALKLEDERGFAAWAGRSGGRCATARIYGLSGPYINKWSAYALACFILDALEDRPIRIRAAHPVYRAYVAAHELLGLVLGRLTQAEAGTTRFDTGAARGYEMAEIAAGVARALGHTRGIERPAMTEAPVDRYVGDGRDYLHLRERYAVAPVGFERQVIDTAAWIAMAAGLRPRAGSLAT